MTLTFFELLPRSSYKIAKLKLLQQSHQWQTHQTFFFFFWLHHMACRNFSFPNRDQSCAPCSNSIIKPSSLREKPCSLLTIADYLCHKRIPNTLTIYKVPITLGSIPLLLTPKLFSYTLVQVNFAGWGDVAIKAVSCPMELRDHVIMQKCSLPKKLSKFKKHLFDMQVHLVPFQPIYFGLSREEFFSLSLLTHFPGSSYPTMTSLSTWVSCNFHVPITSK